jgi:hypothetical protein
MPTTRSFILKSTPISHTLPYPNKRVCDAHTLLGACAALHTLDPLPSLPLFGGTETASSAMAQSDLELEMTVPTPEEIDAAIASIIANVADERGSPDDLWWAYAYDPQGEMKGIGTGWTPAEARALAWISLTINS